MKDKQFLKLIEHAYPDKKQAMYQDLKKELGLPDDPVAPVESRSSVTAAQKPASKRRNFFKRPARLIACISAALVVICSSIVFPIVLNKGEEPTSPPRFCYTADCVKTKVDFSLKEYSELNNLSLLYIDWYDIADEINTLFYVNINDQSDVIYMEETIVNGEDGSIVTLYIIDLHTKVDVFEDFGSACVNTDVINSITVHWLFGSDEGMAHFEYSGYKYFINLRYPMARDSILELVEAMLP